MVDDSCDGFDPSRYDLEFEHYGKETAGPEDVRTELANPSPLRMWAIAKAFEMGMGVQEGRTLAKHLYLLGDRNWENQ